MSTLTELSDWTELMSRGTTNAMSGMSKMLGKEVKITCFDLKPFSPTDGYDMIGGPETTMVGIYLSVKEGARGHILLLYPPKVAFGLIDMLMGNAPDTTQEIGEMEASALSEVGNIVGSYFLSSVADDTGVRLLPSTPQVRMDAAESIINIALEDVLRMHYGKRIFAIQMAFDSDDERLGGTLMILPSADFLRVVESPDDQCSPE